MSASPKKYDVFISFRGEDTRKTFTSQLHHALTKGNIESFIDYNLDKGDEVWPALEQAIRNSQISVVVFSKNYASSKWCLDELVEILECRKCRGQVVIPVFYEVDPSHVRRQTGSYARAFEKYEGDASYRYRVSGWKAALTEAANMSGCDSHNYRDDSQVIEDIVNDVWQKLSLTYPNELKDLVQIDETNKYIQSLLKKLPRIGIWGMGGIGKTTIARHMFAKHFAQYDSVCFLEKVSEESKKFGLTYIRNKLLSELLKRPITESDVLGSTFIKKRLSGKKVFIVLDDVNEATELEHLGGELDDLGPNSRLIITTRDKHMLNGRVDEIYEVTKWEFKESLELFSLKAFNQSHPKEGYECLSERAVTYARGVPLALKVLGSHFHSRNNPEFWESELNYLQNKDESLDEIQDVLKVSYNRLRLREKEMFLDIAFFFKGENKDFVTRILDAYGFNATSGIDILEDKALITISNNNRIQMHDLLQQMALHIVRYKKHRTSRDPGKRSRLRDIEEVCDVLKKGTDAVEGIICDLSQKVDLYVQAYTFNLMTKLRFLRLYVPLGKKKLGTMHHPEVIMPFSDKLRYLEWNGYPWKSLPRPFCAKLLVEIRLPHSNVEHLWKGIQELVNLEAIDLSECKQLMKLPDLSRATKLRWLYLSGCESLYEVQPSDFSKDTLVTLLLDRCKKLESLVSKKHFTSLEKIDVNGCLSLKEFSLSSDSIERLDLSNTGIEILHSSIGLLGKLVWLNLEGLRLQHLPNELSCLKSLTQLSISNCPVVTKSNLEALWLFDDLESLKILYLKDCCNLSELPANISSLSSLYELRLDGSSVKMLPTTIKNLSKLEILCLDNCKKLRCLPELPPDIKEFHADNCSSLVTISSLKTFSECMRGKNKDISFKNDMKLDGPSLDRIVEDVILTMKSATFNNLLVSEGSYAIERCNFNSVKVCLPGGRVPRQMKYRTTNSSITIGLPDLSSSLGFIFSVVVSPPYGMKEHGIGAKIQCQCYSKDGIKVGYASTWHHKDVTNLGLDHVFVWYDPYHYDSILHKGKGKVSFKISVTTNIMERDGFFSIKECGICPIYFSEFPRLKGIMNLDKRSESYLHSRIQNDSKANQRYYMGENIESIESCVENENTGSSTQTQNQDLELNEKYDEREGEDVESIERGDENESTGIRTETHNQQLDLNEKCHYSYDCLIESAEADNRSKDHFSNVEKRIQATHNETKTNAGLGCEENITNFTKAEVAKSKEKLQQSPSPTKNKTPDAIEISSDSSTSLQQENTLGNPNSNIPDGASTSIPPQTIPEVRQEKVKETMAGESSTLIPEYSPLDYSEYRRILEEDPLTIMEKLLSGEFRHSSKTPQSTTQVETIEVQSESIETLLDDLRQLALSRIFLRFLPNDMALRAEVNALLLKLDDRANELSERQNLGLDEFKRFFREATVNIDEGQINSDTLQQLEIDRNDSIVKLQASKDKIRKFDESIAANQNKIQGVNAQIRQLEEQASKLRQEKSLLEDTCSKCQEERAEVVEEVKNVSFETMQTLEKIAQFEKKQQEFNSNCKRLEGLYAKMRSTPPF